MKKNRQYLTLIVALILLSVSSLLAQNGPAAGDNSIFSHIPPGADKVFQLNLDALISKGGVTDLLSKIPKSATGTDEDILNMLKDPSLTGIDIKQDIIVAEVNKNMLDSATWTTVIIHLGDSAKFISAIRKIDKGFRRLHVPGMGQSASFKDGALAWNDKLAIFTIYKRPAAEIAAAAQKEGDGSSTKPKAGAAKPGTGLPAAKITQQSARRSLADLKGYESSFFINNATFKAVLADGGDFHMVATQGSGFASIFKKMKAPGNMKAISDAIGKSGLRTFTTLRFDAGVISIRSILEGTPEQLSFASKLVSRPLNTDLVERIPGGNLLGMVSLHFDPNGLGGMLDNFKVRGKLDSLLSKKDLATSDILKSFTGDFVFAAVQPKPAAEGAAPAKPVVFYFATSINDPLTFMKVGSKLQLVKDSSNGQPGEGPNLMGKMKTAYAFRDKILVISGQQDDANGYFSNTEKRSTAFMSDRLKSNILGIYIDVKKVGVFLQSMMGPSPKQKDQSMLKVLQSFDDITITSGGMQNNQIESYFEIRMADKTQNSLRSLIQLIPTSN